MGGGGWDLLPEVSSKGPGYWAGRAGGLPGPPEAKPEWGLFFAFAQVKVRQK